jgi:starvation-inducible DNA-binding protein
MNTLSTDRPLVELLQELVITETRLAIATREAHWNVTGPSFYSLHEMFGAQYTQIDGFVDDLAERVRQLGYTVSGSPMTGASEPVPHADTLLNQLVDKQVRVELLLKRTIQAAQAHQDEASADMCTGMLEAHFKMMWMLRSSIAETQPALINIQA